MKNYLFRIALVMILLPVLSFAQNWTKLGKQNWPTNPYNIQWGTNGIGNIGNANVQSVWVDPTNSNHILIGIYAGGIYESFNAINGGVNVNWNKITSDIPLHTVRKIVKHNNVIYASSTALFWFGNLHYSNTHGQSKNLYGLGVIKSYDNGQTWQIPSMPDLEKGFECMDFSEPSSTGVMFAISRKQVYKSIDYGDNWISVPNSPVVDGATAVWEEIIVDTNNPQVIWIAGRGSSTIKKIYKSIDGGSSWQEMETFFKSLGSNTTGIKSFSITKNTINNELSVSMTPVSGPHIIFKSGDWQNFQIVNTAYANYAINYVRIKNPNSYYLLGMDHFYKIIGATSAINLTGNKTHVDARSVAFTTYQNTDYIVLGNDGGVSLSADDGNTWTNISGNLVAHIANNMGYYSDPLKRYFDLGTQDCGWYRNNLTFPLDQSQTYFTHNYEGVVYTSPHNARIYANGQYSDDNGATYSAFGYPILEMQEDPLDYNRRYHPGYDSNFNLVDGTNSINIFPSLYTPTLPEKNEILRPKIALNSNNNILLPILNYIPGSIHFPQTTKLVFSKDRGNTWTDIGVNIKNSAVLLPDPMNTASQPLSWVTMDDFNPNRMWVTFGAAGLIDQKVYESDDFGSTWTNISLNLSDVQSLGLPLNTPSNYPINSIEYDENRDILFLGTDYGLLYLDKNSSKVPNWKYFGSGLPKAIISDIYIDDYFNEIVVGTAGSGVWSAPLSNCKDELIMENTSWNNVKKSICGDLRVKHDVSLTVNKSNLSVRNIILEPNSKIIWEGGVLNSSDVTRKSFVIGSRESVFSLSAVTINDFTINNFDTSTLVLNNQIANNSEINIYKDSFFDYALNSTIELNNSNLNFFSNYNYKTHNPTGNPLNGTYVSTLENINMSGNGVINILSENILIQNENLMEHSIPILNIGNYIFKANDNIKTGSNVNSNLINGNFSSESTVELVAKNNITLEDGSFLSSKSSYVHIDSTIPSVITTPYNKESAKREVDIVSSATPLKTGKTSKNETEEKNEIIFFPIPVQDILNYKIDPDVNISIIEIIDLSGKMVHSQKISNKSGKIDFIKFPQGVYYLKYRLGENIITKKIIKMGLTDTPENIEIK